MQQVDSRIIVDTYAWNRFNPNRQVSLSALTQLLQQDTCDDESSEDEYSDYGDESLDDLLADGAHQPGQPKSQTLTNDQLLLCSATLKGYSLKNKKWLTFSINSVAEIKWNDSAFESLVLPNDQKELVLALTESQVANKDSFDDVIQGKGMSPSLPIDSLHFVFVV